MNFEQYMEKHISNWKELDINSVDILNLVNELKDLFNKMNQCYKTSENSINSQHPAPFWVLKHERDC